MSTSIAQRFLQIFAGQIGTLLLTIAITPILVRLLGSSLYGDYAFLISSLSLIMILVNAGIFDGTRKFISEERNENRWKIHVIGFYGQVALFTSTVSSLILLLLVYFGVVDLILGSEFRIYFKFLAGLILLRQCFSFLRGCLMGFNDEQYSEPLQIIEKGVFGLTGIPLAYVGYDVNGVLIGHIVALLITSFLSIRILKRHIYDWSLLIQIPDSFPKRELLNFNIGSVFLIFLVTSLYHADILLLRLFIGSTQTGYYKASLMIAEFLWFVPIAAQTVLLPSSSELWSKDEITSLDKIASKTTRYTLALTLLMMIGIGALSNIFISIYFGDEFAEAVTPLLLLLPGALGFAVARPILAIGQGKGELRILIIATGVATLLNLVLNLVLIPQYGMYGASIATSISYGSMLILHIWAAKQIGFNPIDDLRLIQITFVGLLCIPVIIGLTMLLTPILALLIVPPIGFLLYVFLSIKFGVVDTEDLNRLQQIFYSFMSKQ